MKLGDMQHWHGNEAADRFAKTAALCNLPSQAVQYAQLAATALGKKVYVKLAALFMQWPSFKEAVAKGIWVQPEKPQKRTARETSKHNWFWFKERQLYRFSKCYTTAFQTRKNKYCHPPQAQPIGDTPYLPDRLHHTHTHILWHITKEDDLLWFSGSCGKYAHQNIRRLAQPCTGKLKPRTQPWYLLQKLREGHHPTSNIYWATPKLALRPIKAQQQHMATAKKGTPCE